MLIPLNKKTLPLFTVRLNAIRPDMQGLWGRMTPTELMAHLTRILEISLGEYTPQDKSIPGVRRLLAWLVLRVPWPQGKIKAPPDFTPPPEGDFASERARVLQAMARFVASVERDPQFKRHNPYLGPMTLTEWSRLNGKHFDHHLRQFGV